MRLCKSFGCFGTREDKSEAPGSFKVSLVQAVVGGFGDVASLLLLDVTVQDLSERQNIQNHHMHVSVLEHLGTENIMSTRLSCLSYDSYVPPTKKITGFVNTSFKKVTSSCTNIAFQRKCVESFSLQSGKECHHPPGVS